MIEAAALSKRFGTVDAVSNVSFVARDSEITGLLGPNGAGKSTCLRMMYGVLTPAGGCARIDGIDVRGETSAELARTFGMESFMDRRVKGFSQGQRIKVALARALVHDPGNLILDEPTNGLDVMAMRSLRDMLRTLRAEGRCILFSSHVMQEVAALCDRVVIIGHGRVLAQGTPEAIREQSGAQSLEEAFLHVLGGTEGVG